MLPQELDDVLVPEWQDEIDFTVFLESNGFFAEAAFLVKRHRAIVLADTAFAAYNKQVTQQPACKKALLIFSTSLLTLNSYLHS